MKRCFRVVALVVMAILAGGATCGEAPVSGGDDTTAEWPDASYDVRGDDCRNLGSAGQCRVRSGCKWLSATCSGGEIVAGCFAEQAGPAIPIDCPDTSMGRDASVSDTGTECDSYRRQETCQSNASCRWWTSTCDGRVVERRCVGRSSSPPPPTCADAGADTGPPAEDTGADAGVVDTGGVDAGADATMDAGSGADAGETGTACTNRATQTDCKSDPSCRWWVGACNGYTVKETCIGKQTKPPTLNCKSIRPEDCHQATDASGCYPPNCEWIAKGCGGGTGSALQLSACLPSTSCSSDIDCPARHRCVNLWIDPCAGTSCQACGQPASKCVPMSLLKP